MAEKKKKDNKSKKQLKPSALAIIDNIVFSKTEIWAYYKLSTDVFDFLSSAGKVRGAYSIANGFTALMADRNDPLDIQIIESSVPIDVDAWAVQIKQITERWKSSPGFDKYINDQIAYLKNEEYLRKTVILGINLGKRGALEFEFANPLDGGMAGAKDYFKKWLSTALSIPGEEISVEEEKNARQKEKAFFTILSTGNLQAQRMTSEDLLLTIKRQLYPSMPSPYLDVDHESRIGAGDMELEFASAIRNRYRWLEVEQIINGEVVTGYRACLSFTKFPKITQYPGGTVPFMYFPSKLALPFTLYARLTLVPVDTMRKKISKAEQEISDLYVNASEGATAVGSAVRGGAPQEVKDAVEDVRMMTELITSESAPWVTGSYRIVVETPTEEMLRKYCSIVKQRYNDIGINVGWTAGDQAELFLEQMPGDRVRVKSFEQYTNLAFLATSGFRNSNDVGDFIFESGDQNGK